MVAFNMKILSILTILFLLFLTPCWASTYYVRDGGGTATQCTGTTNATYPGSGSGVACAYSHPRYAVGWDCTNFGTSCVHSGSMVGGDTLFIDGDSDTTPGSQAQYMIGYDSGGATTGCTQSASYDCTLGNLPAGSSTSVRTSIIGTGTHKPQLWGTQRVWQIINADNNHLWLQWLEITDHNTCYLDTTNGGTCDYSSSPYGTWAEDGLFLGGDDVNITDVYEHGVGRYGAETDNIGSHTYTRFYLIGNGQAGYTTGTSAVVSGTITWNQPIVEWNGCAENYPLTSNTIDSPSNYTANCLGQLSNGYGDGMAFGNQSTGNAGNWTLIGPGKISFNTQDGFDTLHGTGTGTMLIDKITLEGNGGNQVKMNATVETITNSTIISDCGWWNGASQSLSGGMTPWNGSQGDACRALGNAFSFFTNAGSGTTVTLRNNTFVDNGNIIFNQNGTCDSGTAFNIKNNIFFGGYDYTDNTNWNSGGSNGLASFRYLSGTDGNGTGCTSPTVNEDYNIVYNTKSSNAGCAGAHDKCGTNPGFSSSLPMGTSGGAANTFYQGQVASTFLTLGAGSSAIGAGVTGLTYWNNSNDIFNVARANPPAMGSIEPNSCAAVSYGCFFNSDCCSGNCLVNACSGNGQDVFGGSLKISAINFK